MLCYYFACKLEDEMKEAGVEPPEKRHALDYFPPYRLTRNIAAINHFVGIDVTDDILREHVINTIKKDILIGIDNIHDILDKLHVDDQNQVRQALYALDLKVYNFRNKFRKGVIGYKRRHAQPNT